MDTINLCAISLRYGEVAWELSVLRGTSERYNPGVSPGFGAAADSHGGLVQLGLFVQLRTAYV